MGFLISTASIKGRRPPRLYTVSCCCGATAQVHVHNNITFIACAMHHERAALTGYGDSPQK
jgi:hypothetical protein